MYRMSQCNHFYEFEKKYEQSRKRKKTAKYV